MSVSNTPHSYGSIAKLLHWLTALLILALIPLGLIASDMPHDTADQLARKATLFSVHKTLGVAVFLVAVLRILWAATQPRPGLLNADRPLESRLAETVHWLLYASLVIVPLSGWIEHAATSGFAPIWWPFGQSLPFVPQNETVAQVFAGLHEIFGKVLIAALILHVAGAVKHHVIDRDATLRRMLPGRVAVVAPPHRREVMPMVTALAIIVLAVGVGTAAGLFRHEDGTAEVARLDEVETGWQVREGTLGIEVRQFGSSVPGSFADWTAAIAFADTPDSNGSHGEVEVTIAIGSLTLGSVTAQALGPDYFDAERFPTATFQADIRRVETGYLADGTLTLRDVTLPVSLPFTLEIEGDTARMQGATSLNRTDYGIGAGQTDEKTLGLDVAVSVSLTADRVSLDDQPAG